MTSTRTRPGRYGAAILAVSLFAASQHAAAEEPDVDAKLREIMAPFIPEIEETAQLMYGIGACERHFKPEAVDFYIREYMASPVPEGLAGDWTKETQDIYRSLYAQGRADAAGLNFDATQCQRIADGSVERVRKAVSDRQKVIANRPQ